MIQPEGGPDFLQKVLLTQSEPPVSNDEQRKEAIGPESQPRRHHLSPHTPKSQGCVCVGGKRLDPLSESFVGGFQSGNEQNRELLGEW